MGIDQVDKQIFMVGRGGQGILLLARALAELAVAHGMNVITSETHGMAMRGGTVTASLKIGSYKSPLIPAGSADILIGLDETEARDFLYMLKPDGISVVNARKKGPFDYYVDATELALDMGSAGSANMIMLGLSAGIMGFDIDEAQSVIEKLSPKKWVEINVKGVEIGYDSRVTTSD
jgi:indolepyruvate ferredoxin oxidoreductase beta subunit